MTSMSEDAEEKIASLRNQLEAVPALPEGHSQTVDQRITEVQAAIDRLSAERDKIAAKEVITDADRMMYGFRQDAIRRQLKQLESLMADRNSD